MTHDPHNPHDASRESGHEPQAVPEPSDAQTPPAHGFGEDDIAATYLSRALKHSFIILKIIMLVLVLVFVGLGFRTVETGERALVLRFGRIRGGPEDRVLRPRTWPYWVMPYPIDEMVRIPVDQTVELSIRSFWYYETAEEMLRGPLRRSQRPPEILDPTKDGYCITRSDPDGSTGDSEGSDYNIVHTRWQLVYRIAEPELFFQNVYVENVKPGQVYFNVITQSLKPLLENLFEDAVVTATVDYGIDDVLYERLGSLAAQVQQLLQEKLDTIESGIKVVQVQLTESTWPRQVNEAFEAAHSASQVAEQAVSEARTYAENKLNEAGGAVAGELVLALRDPAVAEEHKEQLWSQLGGSASERIADARTYKTDIIESARANADYLQALLPEYRKRPELVKRRIYQDTMAEILAGVDEKIIIQPGRDISNAEIWIDLSRDASLKPRERAGTDAQRK
ncbi:MAG TPA: hypothetical protein ENN81_01320 [Phycisphaerales bacterium]|nr:hypothetical protein [Phycisphaerales bacterium]